MKNINYKKLTYILSEYWVSLLIFIFFYISLIVVLINYNIHLFPALDIAIYLLIASIIILVVSAIWQFAKGRWGLGIFQLLLMIVMMIVLYIGVLTLVLYVGLEEKASHDRELVIPEFIDDNESN